VCSCLHTVLSKIELQEIAGASARGSLKRRIPGGCARSDFCACRGSVLAVKILVGHGEIKDRDYTKRYSYKNRIGSQFRETDHVMGLVRGDFHRV
jgi:hypothetical protein